MSITWAQRFAALSGLDGDAWEAEHDRLKSDWLTAYATAFVEMAVLRGWTKEDAESWPPELGSEAWIYNSAENGYDPARQAALDVVECEGEI